MFINNACIILTIDNSIDDVHVHYMYSVHVHGHTLIGLHVHVQNFLDHMHKL